LCRGFLAAIFLPPLAFGRGAPLPFETFFRVPADFFAAPRFTSGSNALVRKGFFSADVDFANLSARSLSRDFFAAALAGDNFRAPAPPGFVPGLTLNLSSRFAYFGLLTRSRRFCSVSSTMRSTSRFSTIGL
jgi:hypothetical protein